MGGVRERERDHSLASLFPVSDKAGAGPDRSPKQKTKFTSPVWGVETQLLEPASQIYLGREMEFQESNPGTLVG